MTNVNEMEGKPSIKIEDEFKSRLECFKCKKIIPLGEYYTKTIISKRVLCSECDKGILDEGDILQAIE